MVNNLTLDEYKDRCYKLENEFKFPWKDNHLSKIIIKTKNTSKNLIKGYETTDIMNQCFEAYKKFHSSCLDYMEKDVILDDDILLLSAAFENYARDSYLFVGGQNHITQSQYLSSIPSTFFTVLLYPLAKKYNFLVGNEISLPSNNKIGKKKNKNQDVAVYVKSPYSEDNIPLLFGECKDTYIDSTMLSGTHSTTESTINAFPFSKGVILTSSNSVAQDSSAISDFEKIGKFFVYGFQKRERDYNKRIDTQVILDFYYYSNEFLSKINLTEVFEIVNQKFPNSIEAENSKILSYIKEEGFSFTSINIDEAGSMYLYR